MQALSDSFGLAFGLIVGLDPDLLEIVSLSLKVSLVAVTFALILGVPRGAALAIGRFPGRFGLTCVMNSFMGIPPVVG